MTVTASKIPALRFPEFEGEWEEKKLGVCAIKIGSGSTPKGGESVYQKVGIPFIRSQNINNDRLDLSRVTFISEEINAQMSGTIVQPLDLLLNITGASIGRSCVVPKFFEGGNVNQHVCIVRLKKNYSPFFIQAKLSSFAGQKAIIRNQVGGSREGLNFQSVRLLKFDLPSFLEQQKITAFLSTIDTRIHQFSRKKALLEQYKKGVMQQIFSQKIRFKDHDGKAFPAWEYRRLSSVLNEHGLKSKDVEEVYSVSVHKGVINQKEHLGRSFAAATTSHYNLVKPHDIIYTKSPTGDFPLGIIKQSRVDRNVIVSPLYGVFTPETPALGYILNDYFASSINTHNYLQSIIQKGAKNTINITNKTFLSKSLRLPVSKEEQQKIAAFLSTLDRQINLVSQQLKRMQTFKKGLLQQMFV
ncbi:MAG TPA: restriction endonuclease subunit S [Haliscomenobacter sp.]|uniref:restriction endonuclease subunit S n=1 Tax=Haliscomenobacter sp. TaxID=2717303 RepID=UPI002B7A9EDE|nr:restriction endonuclease subunit S [Haliscomenobacter sp.]HOY20635.1 restriction endonuclease subunit S [Haliscomenobacter sp.]